MEIPVYNLGECTPWDHLPEKQYNWKTNNSINMKVGNIIQYYAYKILGCLGLGLGGKSV